MRKVFSTFAAVAALFAATPASALTVVTFAGGTGGLAIGETLLASFDGGNNGGITGSGFQIGPGDIIGIRAEPQFGDQGDGYLSVLGVGNAVFSFAGLSQLSLDLGSVDPTNLFTLMFASGPNESFTGTQVSAFANGNQTSPLTNGRLTFTNNTNAITGLTLTSGQNSLEVDNFASISAIPEPATWAMMLIGFGAIGASMRRRRATGIVQLA